MDPEIVKKHLVDGNRSVCEYKALVNCDDVILADDIHRFRLLYDYAYNLPAF